MLPFPRAAALFALLAFAGCTSDAPLISQAGFGGGPPPDSSPAAVAACRQRAEEAFERRDRASSIDTGRSAVDSPYSSTPQPSGIGGLAQRSSYNQFFQDCLRSRGAGQTPTTARPGTAPPSSVPTKP